METTLVTGPSYLPLTLTEAKSFLRITHSDEDSEIYDLIRSATKTVEDICYRKLVRQTWKAFYGRFPVNTVFGYYVDRSYFYTAKTYMEIPFGSLQSVTSVKYLDEDQDESTFSSDNYTVDTDSEIGKITLKNGKSWPTEALFNNNAVYIEFVCGYYAGDLWVAEDTYALNDCVTPTKANDKGLVFKCTTAGTAGASEPTWVNTIDSTTADGTAVWTCVGKGVPGDLKSALKVILNNLYQNRESEILMMGGTPQYFKTKISDLVDGYRLRFF
jgi:uncharacterized phiE125 gp8 family phage protein